MNDTTELKAAAEACGPLPWRLIELGVTRLGVRDDHGFIAFMDIGHPAKYGACPEREAKARFIGHATPDAILVLIADAGQSEQDYKDVVGTIELRDIEIEKLKAENEALRKDADRYRWLRDKSDAIHQFYLSVPLWFTGVRFRAQDVDGAIDAMTKGEQP